MKLAIIFIYCFVAKLIWPVIHEMFGVHAGNNFEFVARWWISNKNNSALNVVCIAILWALWKLRNDMCFQRKTWPGVKDIWRRVVVDLEQCRILSKDAASELLAKGTLMLNKKRGEVMRIAWR